MSTRYNNGSHYENHQRATELEGIAAHTHAVGEEHGKQDHLTGQEHSRLIGEHSGEAHQLFGTATTGHGVVAFGHADIANLAYALWQGRGCPEGSSDEDWFEAVKELRSRAYSH